MAITPSSPNFTQGERKSIKCTGSGYPVPEITWLRNGQKIPRGRIAINITPGGTSLTADLIFTRVSDARDSYVNKQKHSISSAKTYFKKSDFSDLKQLLDRNKLNMLTFINHLCSTNKKALNFLCQNLIKTYLLLNFYLCSSGIIVVVWKGIRSRSDTNRTRALFRDGLFFY